MGVASYHEVLPDRPGKKHSSGKRRPSSSTSPLAGEVGRRSVREGGREGGTRDAPHFPDLDSMGPGTEAVPYREGAEDTRRKSGPRSTLGKPGQRGGWTSKKFKKK
jgi:excinuclease ABC subunit B